MDILHSKIIGRGVPFLILHGYFGMGDNWKSLGNKFAEDFEVHLIDQRNHGRSFHAADFNYEIMVSDLHAYIKHHHIKNCILLGHSMGGKTAMLFAVTYPEFVQKLVIADISPGTYKPHHNEILKGLHSIDFSVHNSRQLVDEKLSELIPEIGVRQFLMKNVYWKEKGQLNFRFNLKSLSENNSKIGAALPNFTSFYGNVLFIASENSGYITDKEEPAIKAHFPNAEIITMADTGHWLHAEKPQEFYDLVMGFVS
ncbi:MAG: alpha/beta fold hydrolase [Flavobacteriaceae bacterium]|nr:MAG: alpha/beta fold hydrolase [Flavobacteriaceae bacterium]